MLHWMMAEEYVSLFLSLLSLERAAEIAESERGFSHQQSFGQADCAVDRLAVASQKVGLYGRHIVILEAMHKTKGKRVLPANSFSNGDIVGLFSSGKPIAGQQISGVVVHSSNVQVSVAFDDLPDSVDLPAHNGMIQLVKLANDVTYRRIKRALECLQSYRSGCCQHLISSLFGQSPLLPPHQKYASLLEKDVNSFPCHTPGLNSSQRRAVVFALSRPDVAIIHGPPGTGKTTTVVELILQAVDLGMKVLACAPSNIAVDNIVEKLSRFNSKVVRIGHPARLVPTVLQYSLDALVANCDSAGIILDVRRDIDKAYTMCKNARNSGDRRKWRCEMKTLRGELKQREEKCLKEILSYADVVLSTLTGASNEGVMKCLSDDHFDLVVIDECAQALEASCWIPLLRAPRCVLAGDHWQLPPTILSQEAADKGLSLTLMERLVKEFGDEITSTLTIQYRMHTSIMTWPSQMLYQDILVAHEVVASHLLSDLPNVSEVKETSIPLVFIDTAGCGLHELETGSNESKGNEGEADLVVHHIKKLRNSGVLDRDIAVIAPYSLQVDLIRQRVHSLFVSSANESQLEVHTVDGFQGREKEAIIMSLTRSNKKGEYGFLKEQRRSNVAVTRARRHLCLIGDSDTVSHEPFMKGMIDYCHQNAEVWSAHEYLQDPDFEKSQYYQPKVNPKSKDDKKENRVSKKAEGKMKQSSANATAISMSKKADTAVRETLPALSGVIQTVEDEGTQDLKKCILEFLEESDAKVLSFSPSLTGNERKIVHELCEQFGLLHESKGQGKERFIEVRKMREDNSTQVVVEDHAIPSQRTPLDSKEQICDLCGHAIPVLNWELHHMQCVKSAEDIVKGRIHHTPVMTSKERMQKERPPQNICKRPSAASKSEPDVDELIAEMTKADSTCKFPKCSKSVSLLGVQCLFCKQHYCVEHSLAEVHGCGEAARLHSRREHREIRSTKSAGATGVKRSQLEMKLKKKLDEKTTARQTKKKK